LHVFSNPKKALDKFAVQLLAFLSLLGAASISSLEEGGNKFVDRQANKALL